MATRHCFAACSIDPCIFVEHPFCGRRHPTISRFFFHFDCLANNNKNKRLTRRSSSFFPGSSLTKLFPGEYMNPFNGLTLLCIYAHQTIQEDIETARNKHVQLAE